MKIKKYDVFISGGEKIGTVLATCITRACKGFIGTLDKEAKYELYSKCHASVRYVDNFTICGDYVIMEQ